MAGALNGIEVHRPVLTSIPARIAEKGWNFFFGNKPYLYKYGFEDRLAEERAFWTAVCHRAQILHVLYGDEQLDLLLRRAPFLPARLVATFHLPVTATRDRFERAQKEEIKRLSGAVVQSSCEVSELAHWLGAEKVIFIPHPVDIDAFTPRQISVHSTTARFLFVGFHMRDFEVAHCVADQCAFQGLDVIFDVVLPPDKLGFFEGCSNVRRHSDISESALIALYQNADALFLPLIDATANNTVLEAMACGTPVISTRVGGVKDYVNEESGWLLPPRDTVAAFDCIRGLIENRDLALDKGRGARRQAELFSLARIANELNIAYKRLLETGHFAA